MPRFAPFLEESRNVGDIDPALRGSTIALTDAQGKVTDTYAYHSFGQLANQDGESRNQFLYLGRYGIMEEGDGLSFARKRHFSPELGRFLSMDPLSGTDGNAQTFNGFIYGLNNPDRFEDITGLSSHDSSKSPIGDGSIWTAPHPSEGCPYKGEFVELRCTVVWPSGVDIDENIKNAKIISFLNPGLFEKRAIFAVLVRPGGVWDYNKGGKPYEYEAFGNFHYGVVGRAMGLSRKELLIAAGLVQEMRGSGGGSGTPLIEAPYGDDALDQFWINKGVDFYEKFYAK